MPSREPLLTEELFLLTEELFLKCLAVNPLHVTALAFYGLYIQEVCAAVSRRARI